MSAARLPAWSSPNFFQTATGKASHGHRCWVRSAVATARFSALIPPGTYPVLPAFIRGGLKVERDEFRVAADLDRRRGRGGARGRRGTHGGRRRGRSRQGSRGSRGGGG